MTDFEKLEFAKAESAMLLFDFLRIELGLSSTFVELASTRLGVGDQESAYRLLAKAESACRAIMKLLVGVVDPEQQNEILQGLVELGAALDEMHARLSPRSAR